MYDEPQYSNLIYEYFIQKLHFQYYKQGEFLPSIDTLCRTFYVSSQTVKAAMQRLRKEGYISMHNGQNMKILYSQTPQETAAYSQRFYAQRSETCPDLFTTSKIIFIPLLIHALKLMNKEDVYSLAELVKNPQPKDLLYFYCLILQKTDNPLIMNLFWELALFQAFPISHGVNQHEDTAQLIESMRHVVSCTENQQWDKLEEHLLILQAYVYGESFQHIKQSGKSAAVPQIPFIWRIYRERPQVCYSFAMRLLHEIYLGEYSSCLYLPSYEQMAERYHLSISTIRRTIQLLNHLGAVKTINGKGTRLFKLGEKNPDPDFTDRAVRRNLAFFYQAFELIIHSCETAAASTFQSLTQTDRKALIDQLTAHIHLVHCVPSLWRLLICIASSCPLAGIREIYGKFYGLFLWGYPLKASVRQEEDESLQFTENVIAALKASDDLHAAELMKEEVMKQFPKAERYLLAHGMTSEELRLPLAFRLLLPSDSKSNK